MPMIDLYSPAGLLPTATTPALLAQITRAVLRAEGAPERSPYLENTAAFLHELPPAAVATAARGNAPVVRVDVRTPPATLTRQAQQSLVAEVTRLVADAAADPDMTGRVWVVLSEAAEGGWGVAGRAMGAAEFAAARADAAATVAGSHR
jgi:phenylpyruvate tautomerase PptA (4-oxalocrotonate tautomerase family)